MMLKLAIKNLLHKPLSTLLCWILLSVSVGIISLLIILQEQFEQQFSNNIKGIDMVIGAKGSPLQLILSAVYHTDVPTGNIKYAEAEKWMRHPFVEEAIPLAYGDSYKGYSIIGTTKNYLSKYEAVIDSGRVYEKDFEVVIGSSLAKKLELRTGSRFFSIHGNDEHGEEHKSQPYTVTGVLKPTGTVVDNLIVGNIESVWRMHEHHNEKENPDIAGHTNSQKQEHDRERSDVKDDHANEQTSHDESEHKKEITAVLLKFRNPMASIQWPRMINQQTNMMTAVPAIEINRLFTLFGAGISLLKNIGWGIMFLSGLSVFIALFNSLKERKYEMALMRTMGAARGKLLLLVLTEGLVLCLAGLLTGLLLSRIALFVFNGGFEKDYHFSVKQWALQMPGEIYLLLLTLCVGVLAAIVPAVKAWFINISKTLSNG